ncbi:uncharacterized protein btla isoform 2-T8 [Aulostomus maculatus]
MLPHRHHFIRQMSVLAVLLLTLRADTQNCTPEFYVRSNTVYEACVGDHLQIECPVIVCREQDLQTITWYTSPNNSDFGPVTKSTSTDSGWNHFGLLNGTTFLIFRNIQTTNSGLYQCQTGFSRSHKISVIVHGTGQHRSVTYCTSPSTPSLQGADMWMYASSVAGIVAFVIMVVIISIVAMECKGKSKQETRAENQDPPIHLAERPVLHTSLQPSPSRSRPVPPSRQSPRKNAPRDLKDCVYGDIKEMKERQRKTMMEEAEEGSSIVYAALNHDLPAGAPARPLRPKEEGSEYAAIQVY